MKYTVLDTNFILSCLRKKIDFFEEIQLMGLHIIIPVQVIKELENISNSKKKLHFKEDAKTAVKFLESKKFKKTGLDGKNVDYGIIKLARENEDFIVATLDREIRHKTKNPKLVIRGNKKLEIVTR